MASTLIIYRYAEGGPLNSKVVSPFIDLKVDLYGESYNLDWYKMGFSELNYKNELSGDAVVVTKDMVGFMQSRPNVLVSICINNVGIIAIYRDCYQYFGKIQKARGFQIVDNYGDISIPNMDSIKTECIGLLRSFPLTSLYASYPNRLYVVNKKGYIYLSLQNDLKYVGPDFKYSLWNTELNKISAIELASSNDEVLALYFDDKGLLKQLTKEELKNGL